ncbi:MAG: glycosyltransferase family 4 protein, partial [Bacteroidales bacterium]|nr:glycosyltransferase family 4 protein [Bacteroidales bacterium]
EEGSTSSSSGSAVQPELQTGPLSKPVTSLVDTDTSNEKFGVNISGYITGDFGVGEAARCLIRAVQAGNIPHVLRNIDVPWHNCSNQSFKDFQEEAAYPINIVCVNADMVPVFHKEAGQGFLTGRRNIGTWFWELASFPEKWFPSFSYFHEIWVASSFCAEALAKVSPIPVVKITYPIVLDVEKIHPNRQFFGLDEQTTVFLFTFDLHSVFERKNPLAIVDAFKRAFRKDDDVVLVLKTINSDRYPEQMNQLNEAMSGHRIRILDGHISSQDMLSLLASCDCYVSLHRAEGLGLSMAKCMLMGKPVIATGYSGNLDFMNLNNSLLIKYKLVELEKDYGPYTKGNEWAEPDVDHAVELMRRLYEDKDLRIRIGKRASKDIQTRMNPQVAFETIRPRLFRVGEWPHPQGGE